MDITTAASALSIVTSLSNITDHRDIENRLAGDTSNQTPEEAPVDRSEEARKLDQLIEIQGKNQPTPGDKDAFTSATVTLEAGETVEVTVEPVDGYNLRVKRIHFDRHTDHSYQINVGGDVTSVSHRAKYASPKLVSQSDRVLASATNNSGSKTVVDFEMEAWAEKP